MYSLCQKLNHHHIINQKGVFMPNLFLSPSVQEYNPYVNGLGSEEYYMNLIADAMEPLSRIVRDLFLHEMIRMIHSPRLSLFQMPETTIFILHFTPTHLLLIYPARYAALIYITMLQVPREDAPLRSSKKTLKPSIPIPIMWKP